MRERRQQIIGNAAAFCLLFLVSVYRQLSLKFLPGSRVCIYIVFAAYLVLIAGWCISMIGSITQKSLLRCLLSEAVLMAAGITGRFLQDAFFYTDTQLMRTSGLVIAATVPLIALLAIYAAMGMGQADSYRIPGKYLALGIPVILMSGLLVADDRQHFIFRLLENDPQPNLFFHPFVGFWVLAALLIGMLILRIVVIFRRNHIMDDRTGLRVVVSLAEPLLLLVFMIPYLLSAMYHTPEIIEVFAMLYYTEALTWEMYIALGLVPANTAWGDVFAGSTLAMQIMPGDGSGEIFSANADPVAASALKQLEDGIPFELPDGAELHLYRIPGGEVIYRKDTVMLKQTLRELDSIAESLEQESGLLARELQAGNRETGLAERGRIYGSLRKAVSPQLERMEQLISAGGKGDDDEKILRILCILGTYVKRKCNLLLLREEQGCFGYENLMISLEDLFRACRDAGIGASFGADEILRSEEEAAYTVYEITEALLEIHDFRLREISVREEADRIIMKLVPEKEYSLEEVRGAVIRQGFNCVVRRIGDISGGNGGYEVILTGGDGKCLTDF